MTERKPRATSTRDHEERAKTWTPPDLLPTPDPRPGVEFRWIRSSSLGKIDNVNVSSKFREGWTPVPASEFPELNVMTDHESRFPENIEVGGLILCQCATEIMNQKRAYMAQRAEHQIEAVDNNYLREGDPRMPLLRPERKTSVSRFGNG